MLQEALLDCGRNLWRGGLTGGAGHGQQFDAPGARLRQGRGQGHRRNLDAVRCQVIRHFGHRAILRPHQFKALLSCEGREVDVDTAR